MANNIEDAARALQDLLVGQFVNREVFSIGIGEDKLHAFIRCAKKRWPVGIPDSANGVPIEWHWGVGPARAQTS